MKNITDIILNLIKIVILLIVLFWLVIFSIVLLNYEPVTIFDILQLINDLQM